MAWEIHASSYDGSEHIADFKSEYYAMLHRVWCIQHYDKVTPIYEIDDDSVEYYSDYKYSGDKLEDNIK